MIKRLIWGSLFIFLLSFGSVWAQGVDIDRLAEGVYATVARPNGKLSFNVLFWVGNDHVAAAGSCLDPEDLAELTAAVASVTDRPLRYCILAPARDVSLSGLSPSADLTLILNRPSRQTRREDSSPLPFSFLYFRDDLTLELAGRTVTLLSAERGGDLAVFLPDDAVLYIAEAKSSDCRKKTSLSPLRKRSASWQKAQKLGAKIVVPACGSLVNSEQ